MRLLAILIIRLFTPSFLATNVFREEDLYLIQFKYDLSLHQEAIKEIANLIKNARKKSTYLLKISFQTLSTPTMSYLRRNEGKQAQQEKYDIQLYVIQTSLDRFKSFHIDLGMTWGMKMLSKTKSVFITHWKTECT